jgi:hypothetical protein
VLIAAIIWLFIFAFAQIARLPFSEEYKRFEAIKIGMTAEDVLATLGEPDYRYAAATAPDSYYVPGYSYRKREITSRVLIYVATEAIAYVYIDPDGRVEETFVGGS